MIIILCLLIGMLLGMAIERVDKNTQKEKFCKIINWLHNDIQELYDENDRLERAVTAIDNFFKPAREAQEAFESMCRGEAPNDIPEYTHRQSNGLVYLPQVLKDAGMIKSNGEGRRLIEQGAVKVDGKATQISADLSGTFKVRIGKRKWLLLTITN